MTRQLVALDLAGGQTFVDELRRAWDDHDAVLPIDQRLSAQARSQLVEAMGASVVVDESGRSSTDKGGEPVESGDALVVPTSGSTGVPKGVVLTHDAVAASARATSHRLSVEPGTDRWLACLPLAHVGGLSVVTRAVLTGTPLEVHPGFDADAVTKAARGGTTLVSLVPTALGRIDPSLFRVIVLGGSAIPPDRPSNSVATYGMTESGSGVVYDGVPLDDVEVMVADGEIHLRCPMLLRCYRDGIDPKRADGWYPTGDLGTFDGGRLVVEGRRDDLIISGGENIWPERVERVLAARDDLDDVAIVGLDDEEWGQQVVALVVGPNPPTLEEVREHVGETLPRWWAPRRMVVVESIPRTALGKVRRGVAADVATSAAGDSF